MAVLLGKMTSSRAPTRRKAGETWRRCYAIWRRAYQEIPFRL